MLHAARVRQVGGQETGGRGGRRYRQACTAAANAAALYAAAEWGREDGGRRADGGRKEQRARGLAWWRRWERSMRRQAGWGEVRSTSALRGRGGEERQHIGERSQTQLGRSQRRCYGSFIYIKLSDMSVKTTVLHVSRKTEKIEVSWLRNELA
jgi:hypothetical protein